MAVIAVYNLKGGVGKTSLAVNLAFCSAIASARRTLLWDLDAQAAASFILIDEAEARDEARAIFAKDVKPEKLVRATRIAGLDLIAADMSLRGLDRLFFDLAKKKRLQKLIERLDGDYERIILDAPPGLTETSEQIVRAADIVLVPVIPSPLSERAFRDVQQHFQIMGGHPPMLPVYSMVDRRRRMHRAALERQPEWPVIPMSSAIERMSLDHRPVGEAEPRGAAALAIKDLWTGIERRLARKA